MLFIWCTNHGIVAKLKKCASVNPEFCVLAGFFFSLLWTSWYEQEVNQSIFPLQIADCEKKHAKSHESRSFYIFKRYLNKILNEAGKLGLVSIWTVVKNWLEFTLLLYVLFMVIRCWLIVPAYFKVKWKELNCKGKDVHPVLLLAVFAQGRVSLWSVCIRRKTVWIQSMYLNICGWDAATVISHSIHVNGC